METDNANAGWPMQERARGIAEARPAASRASTSPRPNLFVVGDAKCGTTSLYYLFAATQGIGTVRRKEFHFFSAPELLKRINGPGDENIPAAIIQDKASYLGEFSGLRHDLPTIVDVSPSYLKNPHVPERIRAFAPDARIIILLREPSAKVFSQYVHLWTRFQEDLPFEEALDQSAARRSAGYSDMFDYEEGGLYYESVRSYLETFGPDRVLIVFFEELLGQSSAVRKTISDFVGVELANAPLVHANIGGRIRNPLLASFLGSKQMSQLRRAVLPPALRGRMAAAVRTRVHIDKPVLSPETRSRLRRRFAPDVEALEQLLGRKSGWLVN